MFRRIEQCKPRMEACKPLAHWGTEVHRLSRSAAVQHGGERHVMGSTLGRLVRTISF